MRSTKVFTSGNSQAVRIPKDVQVQDEELFIQRVGRALILFPKSNPWESLVHSLGDFTDDFMAEGRNQPAQQERNET